jgi:hypothetical protein
VKLAEPAFCAGIATLTLSVGIFAVALLEFLEVLVGKRAFLFRYAPHVRPRVASTTPSRIPFEHSA